MIKSTNVQTHLDTVLSHLYINPLEKCNLKCKICYTRKTDPILTPDEITEFITRYQKIHKIETITFCGGEVFTLKYYPQLVNSLTDQGIFVQMITNGTVDRLDEFTKPNSVNLIVSIDGREHYHDANRGEGNHKKSIAFLKKSQRLGFHSEIFSIVTRDNFSDLSAFELQIKKECGVPKRITYHPRKPPTYLMHHPISNIVGETTGFGFLTHEQMMEMVRNKNVFPPKELGCYQIALTSDGKVYGCCEGTIPLGVMSDPIEQLLENLQLRLEAWENKNTLHNCLGCSQHEFMCGIKDYLVALQQERI